MRYDTAKNLVTSGNSKVFNYWLRISERPTDEFTAEFLEGINWLCEDPQDGGLESQKPTRSIGLINGSIIRMKNVWGATKQTADTVWLKNLKTGLFITDKEFDGNKADLVLTVMDSI